MEVHAYAVMRYKHWETEPGELLSIQEDVTIVRVFLSKIDADALVNAQMSDNKPDVKFWCQETTLEFSIESDDPARCGHGKNQK